MSLRSMLFLSTILSGIAQAGPSAADIPDLVVDDNAPYEVTGFEDYRTVWIGQTNAGQSIDVVLSGHLFSESVAFGVDTSSRNNTATLSGIWTNSGTFTLGYNGSGNTLTLENGGDLSSTSTWLGGFAESSGNRVFVDGAGSTLVNANDLTVGYGSAGNAVILRNGGTASNLLGYVGFGAAADGNSVTATGIGSAWTTTEVLSLGFDGSDNSLIVADGATATVGADMLVGANAGSDGNKITISGAQSQLSVARTLYLGRSGSNNTLLVEAGGTLTTTNGRIGGGTGAQTASSGNTATVTGEGSRWALSGSLRIGDGSQYASTGNSLRVENGGVVSLNAIGKSTFVGFTPSDANNSLSVTGAGSAFSSLGDILVGAASMSDPNPQPKNSLLAVELGGRVSTPGGLAIGGTSTLRVGAGASVSARDLALQTGSALEIGVDADAAGVIALAGTARLNGTLAASFTGESFQKSYTILSADQAVTGAFASYTAIGLPAFFSSALSYGPAEVTLTVAADFALVPGLTPNESAVGTALTGIINAPGSTVLEALPAALSPLYALDASQLPQALDALSGESYASQEAVLLGDSLYSRLALMGRLRQGAYAGQSDALAMLSNGGPTLTTSTKGTGLAFMSQGATTWGQVYGSRTDLDGQADTSDVTSNFGGVITGADTQIENWLVGAALGYSQSSTNVDDLSSSSDVDSLTGALYGGTSNGPWNVRLGASYASNQTEATRTIAYPGYAEQASADYDSATTQVFAEVAYGMAVGTAAIEPFAGLAWINVDTDGFSETGASAGLSVSSSSSSVTYGTLGVRAATNVEMSDGMVLQPRGSLALQTASGDLSPSAQMAFLSAPGTGFTVSGAPLAENTGLIELGADLLISEQARLGLSYIGQYADGVSTYGIQASMTWTF